MLTFTTPFINTITSSLTKHIISGAASRIRRSITGTEGEQAMQRCVHAGVVAVLSQVSLYTPEEKDLLEDIFKSFFSNPDTGKELSGILAGKPLDMEELKVLFEHSGYDPNTLQGLRFEQAAVWFEAAFLAAASQEPVFQPIIQIGQLMEHTRIQHGLLSTMKELVEFLKNSRLESVFIEAGLIIAQNAANGQKQTYAPYPAGPVGGEWEGFYLKRLIEKCDRLDLTPLDETAPRDSQERGIIKVSEVFTTLYLKGIERMPGQSISEAILRKDKAGEKVMKKEAEKHIPIHATEAVSDLDRLVILGRPGGGKSTLVNHISAQLAKRRLNDAYSDTSLPGWPKAHMPMPVRIILRQFAAWIPIDRKRITEGLVWDYIENQLKDWGCQEFYHNLKYILDEKGGIIFFDGLDEIEQEDEGRKQAGIVEAISKFSAPLKKCRVIVTCREYAYNKKKKEPDTDNKKSEWLLPETEFPVVELELFRPEQIRSFTHTWYQVTGRWKDWDDKKCDSEAHNLYHAIESWPHLRDLGQYPLLLTLMAQVHGRDGYLPRDRADLYERAVNLLLAHWQNRIVRDLEGVDNVEPGIIEKLGINVNTMRGALEHVALSAHECQEKEKGDHTVCAYIVKEDLRQELASGLGNSLDKADKVIAYIQNRAGLLQAHDNKTFSFPHRTFQEYLAATCILKKADFEIYLKEAVARNLPWWQEVFLLAAGASRNTPKNIYDMVASLLPDEPTAANITSEIADYSRLAAQAMGETGFMEFVKKEQNSGPGRYSRIHKRIQEWLLAAVGADTALTPKDRSDSGTALNWIGDPRFDPEKWYLPFKDNMGFVKIPAGGFLMGSYKKKDKEANSDEFPQHTVKLSEYYIARYPVTVAQYRVFLNESGNETDKEWEKWNRQDNHPVVIVSWHDAMKYCRWLSKKRGKRISLPTEAQWEKAARGTEGTIYPWGDEEIRPNRANYSVTGIQTTSPVGCFPAGTSPYGIMDMIGNVWEWCLDHYKREYTKKIVTDPIYEKGSVRVVRGGSWDFVARACRAAYRYGSNPGSRIEYQGFRLVLLPGQ